MTTLIWIFAALVFVALTSEFGPLFFFGSLTVAAAVVSLVLILV